MTEPSRTSPDAIEKGDTDSRGPLDSTHLPADGAVVEPNFSAPAHKGEVGQLGRYRVLKKLGQGGMGAVYLGHDGALDRKVALKVMLPQYAANTDARERFLREARAAAKVKSDHVVTIFDVGQERGVPFLAMEYLLGMPLDQFLKKKGELPLAQVLRVSRETAVGLAAAHDLGLIHRDIKPANIWLEAPNGRVKILDFGLARPVNDAVHLTDSGVTLGTPAFMSPEQGRGQKLDHRSDLFSLGVMLYRLATGKMPFDGASTMAVLTALAVDAPVAPRQHNPQLPEALEAVITRLLVKNPAERFPSARAVVDALAAVATGPLPVVVALAVGAQTQNVWEGIGVSESVPVPLETGSESGATPAPESRRAKPERNRSKLPLLLAGAAALAAVAVLAVAVSRALKKEKEPVVQNEPDEKRPKAPPGKQPPAATDFDRKGAEHVLSVGGALRINGEEREIKAAADLPKGRFELTAIALHDNPHVTDAWLAHFKDCKNLTHIHLWNAPVTDAGLVHFKGRKNLTSLFLVRLNVGDEGLAHFKDCKGLTALDLGITQVTDAGLAHFKGCNNLEFLSLAGTRVSDAGLANFKGCKNIQSLNLDHVPATDVGLANFKECENMRELQLKDTQANDAGLAHFKDCKHLQVLHLDRTRVSDEGLAHFKNCKLAVLALSGTKVTAQGIAEFAKAQPQCRLEHDSGVTEPKR